MRGFAVLALAGLLAGCAAPAASKQDNIPFGEDDRYAAAWVGYQAVTDLAPLAEEYLDSAELPVYYVSPGDFYLVVPRDPAADLALYRLELETEEPVLLATAPDCGPFLVQCNVSDIIPDVRIELTAEGETAVFTPFLSLKDGALDVGEQGLELTVPGKET